MIFTFIQAVLIIAAAAICFTFVVWSATRIIEWWDIKQDLKWDVNLFPVPKIIPELEGVDIVRGVNLSNRTFTFSWESDGNVSNRTYRFLTVKSAIANYERSFTAEERKFFERNHTSLKATQCVASRLTALEGTVKHILSKGKDNV